MADPVTNQICALLADLCQIVKEHEQALHDLQPESVQHEVGQAAGYERRIRIMNEALAKLREV
jgi:hypothetical protein